ncbi:hypothetical protein ACGFZP_13335 [Kitasatospora sp. NPDC048239]|uniref:hypothetical protein n=1 Tax=Kitasatospora sp. NPDC048239 TaxID=3364046 RepID=UPI00371EADE6
MSAPLNISAEQMRELAAALDAMSEMTRTTGVDLTPNGRRQIGIADNMLSIIWSEEVRAYVIDDRIGD